MKRNSNIKKSKKVHMPVKIGQKVQSPISAHYNYFSVAALLFFGILGVFQVQSNFFFQHKINDLERFFKDLPAPIVSINDHTSNAQYSKVDKSERKNSAPNLQVPHAHYNIPLDEYGIPIDPLKEYYFSDLKKVFNVNPLKITTFSEEVENLLGPDFDIEKEAFYIDYVRQIKIFTPYAIEYIENMGKYYNEKDLAIVWVSKEIGFGVVAKRALKQHEIVGIYTGHVYIEHKGDNSDYRWAYRYGKKGDPKPKISIGLDAREQGNVLRFINHDELNFNCLPTSRPYNNRWYMFYVTSRDIAAGEALTTNYGKGIISN